MNAHINTVTIDVHIRNKVDCRHPVEILSIPEDLDIVWGALLRGKCGQKILSCCETGLRDIEDACCIDGGISSKPDSTFRVYTERIRGPERGKNRRDAKVCESKHVRQ